MRLPTLYPKGYDTDGQLPRVSADHYNLATVTAAM
jgi:hypothetical protein